MASVCTSIQHTDEGCTLTISTKRNGENVKISRTTKSIAMMEKFKRIHERKIPKFGDYKQFALKESDNVVLKLSLDSKEVENAHDEQFEKKIEEVSTIKCRNCGGQHLTIRCPNKELQSSRPLSQKTSLPAKSNKYVAPSLRGLDQAAISNMALVSYSVRVSNLFPECQEQDLREVMSKVGRISRMYFPTVDGKAKGYAYVNYGTMEEVNKAIEMINGIKFGSVILGVELSQSKKP